MKIIHLVLLAFISSWLPIPAHCEDVCPISIRVESRGETTFTRTAESQSRSLVVYLANATDKEQAVTVKYYFFGRASDGKESMVLHDGKASANLKPHGTETLESEHISAASVKAGPKRKASGTKIVGYGAQVFQDGKLLAAYFSEPSFKSNVGGGD